MFCNKCGHKLTNTSACPNCGAPTGYAEYCGGFWGLVGDPPQMQQPKAPAEQPVIRPDKKKVTVLGITCGVLALLLAFQMFQTYRIVQDLKQTREAYQEAYDRYRQLLEEEPAFLPTEAVTVPRPSETVTIPATEPQQDEFLNESVPIGSIGAAEPDTQDPTDGMEMPADPDMEAEVGPEIERED